MLNDKILNDKVQEFIEKSMNESVEKLALRKNPFPDIPFKEILIQIQSKQKAKKKLPTWFSSKNIIYPEKISIEQTSSEITAQYKSKIVSGKSLIDLTGGFGVDAYYFSKKIETIYHCEINPNLSNITNHNFEILNIKNCVFYIDNGTDVLSKLNKKYDWIYIDPSRRNNSKGKVFMLKDCLPNVPELLDFYFNFSNSILIKTAPILDISAGLSELKFVKKIHIISVENEVKELLWEIEKKHTKPIEIKTINFTKTETQEFDFEKNTAINKDFELPKTYIYEPNSAIMKSNGFWALETQFQIKKLHLHSHLFTSEKVINFPGRKFKLEKEISYSKKEITETIFNTKANITLRNFPDTVENIRKKLKITEGGDLYYFFTTNKNEEKIVLICTKI